MDVDLLVNGALGALMPLLISWLKGNSWPKPVKVIFSLALCAAVGCAIEIFKGNLDDVGKLSQGAMVVMTTAMAVYGAWFKGTNLNKKLSGGADA